MAIGNQSGVGAPSELSELCARAQYHRDLALTGGRRDVVDALMTIAWTEALLHRSGLSAHALGKQIEPSGYVYIDSVDRHHRNKFSKYQRGLNKPGPAMLEMADRAYPGSSSVMRLAIWRLLRDPPSTIDAAFELRYTLSDDVRRLLAFSGIDGTGGQSRSLASTGAALLGIGKFDALAGLALLFQSAFLCGEMAEADEWVAYTHQCLAILSVLYPEFRVWRALFELLDVRLFSKAGDLAARRLLDVDRYEAIAQDLCADLDVWAEDLARRPNRGEITDFLRHRITCHFPQFSGQDSAPESLLPQGAVAPY